MARFGGYSEKGIREFGRIVANLRESLSPPHSMMSWEAFAAYLEDHADVVISKDLVWRIGTEQKIQAPPYQIVYAIVAVSAGWVPNSGNTHNPNPIGFEDIQRVLKGELDAHGLPVKVRG